MGDAVDGGTPGPRTEQIGGRWSVGVDELGELGMSGKASVGGKGHRRVRVFGRSERGILHAEEGRVGELSHSCRGSYSCPRS